MLPGRNHAALALAVIVLSFSSVAAKICVLGTEQDPSDGGRIKLVLPEEDPCTCTEVHLGGHNACARPRPGGEQYIDIRHLKGFMKNGLGPLFNCTKGREDGTSIDYSAASNPEATTDAPKSTRKVITRAQSTTTVAPRTTSVSSTPVDPTPVLSSTAEPTEPPADCQEILDAGQTTSGVYTIQHDGQNMQVYCRMDSGNGYIVFQRRQNGSVSFDRTWQKYAEGFGDLTGEFWLGNEQLHSLTADEGWELVITLRAFDGDEARVRYGLLRLETQNSYDRYELVISGFSDESGNAGDSLRVHRDEDFSTRDADWERKKCAETYRGGWWYGDCGSNSDNFQSNLNGLYYDNATVAEPMQGIQWSTWKGNQVSLKGCEMMIRRRW